ncbi:hypothetical protein CC86DRAFT_408187 [Ophiobolus disseminans]|uniref:Rhodopsin domain-containing protein n=1 Tax=Ophiobolus disseminans TaxID=1469910 RepID=A0A6A6ZVG1_9PLEO|nr:hypothetical protein CC86DRAFT_408187 [Ophiobolus disseminans]
MAPNHTPEYLRENISGPLFTTCIIFLGLETVFILLLWTSRYYAAKERRNSVMEIFMTLTYITCCGKIAVVILLITHGGTGRHTASLTPPELRTALKLSLANSILCPVTTSLSKLGVLIFLHRILAHLGRWYRIVIRTTFVVVVLVLLVQILIPFVNCRPFRKTWEPRTPGTCAMKSLSLWRYAGNPNAITTLIVVAIPVPALARMKVSRGVKCGMAIVFAVCLAGIMAAFMRVYTFLQVENFDDITYENAKPMFWIIAESGIYLIAGIMLTLRPLVAKVFKGTALERILATSTMRNSRGWGGRKLSLKRYRTQRQIQAPAVKKERSVSDVKMVKVTIERPDFPRAYRPDGQWI